MKADIFESKPEDDAAFAVSLLPVSGFPDDGPVDDIVRPAMKAVIACRNGFENGAGVFQEGWSFIHLEIEEKHAIGDALVSHGAEDNQWYWCILWNE